MWVIATYYSLEIWQKAGIRTTNTSTIIIDHVIANIENYTTYDIKENTYWNYNTIWIKMVSKG